MAAIVHAEDELGMATSAYDLRSITMDGRREIKRLDDRRDPIACWVGEPAIGSALVGLWRTYQPIGESWARTLTSTKRQARISAAQERRLWRQLAPFHSRLPTLHVYTVDYVRLVALPIPPISTVVGIGARDPEGRTYVSLVTAAAQELVTIRDEIDRPG